MASPGLSEAQTESRWEAAPAVLLVIGLQLLLALVSRQQGWTLGGLPWWTWLAAVGPELALLAALSFSRSRHRLEQLGHRRTVAITLISVISVANALALGALIASLVNGQAGSGGKLLLEAVVVWGTNVILFGLAFWELDRGGPVRRRESDPPPPSFQFPQMENPALAEPGWHPRLFDYVYVSFTNSIAFSPTDAMPLTLQAKKLMLCESTVSALTLLLVAARAVNILR